LLGITTHSTFRPPDLPKFSETTMPTSSINTNTAKPIRTSSWSIRFSLPSIAPSNVSGQSDSRAYETRISYNGSTPEYDDVAGSIPISERPIFAPLDQFRKYISDSQLPLNKERSVNYLTNLHWDIERDMKTHACFKGTILTGIQQETDPLSFHFSVKIGTEMEQVESTHTPLLPPPLEDLASEHESDSPTGETVQVRRHRRKPPRGATAETKQAYRRKL
jgi:hypothetical protein